MATPMRNGAKTCASVQESWGVSTDPLAGGDFTYMDYWPKRDL